MTTQATEEKSRTKAKATKTRQSRKPATTVRNGDHQLFHEGRSTRSADIRQALPVKHNAIFMLLAESGDIPPDGNGYGIETYWMENAHFLAMAIAQGGNLVRSIGSNAGKTLLTDIVDSDRARDDYPDPVRYPVACNPQSWAAGSLPLMLSVLRKVDPEEGGILKEAVKGLADGILPHRG